MNLVLSADTRIGRIVHTTDFSPGSRLAFVHALKLALAVHGEFTLVHIDIDGDRSNNDWRDFPRIRETLAGWGVLEANAPASAISEQLGMSVRKVEVGHKDPLDGVLGLLGRYPIDLLVLASRADGGVFRPASVSQPLARKINAPTLFLPNGGRGFVDPATGEVRLRRILVPVGDRPAPGPAIEFARRLADVLGAVEAEVSLLHVGGDWPSVPSPPGRSADYTRLERSGPVIDAIVEAAEEIDADLVVMATEGHDSLRDTLLGSTTEQVLRSAKRALIAVPVG